MRILDLTTFLKTVVVGALATYMMTLAGVLQAGLGLPRLDLGQMIMHSMNAGSLVPHYGPVIGNLFHLINGIVLALIYVAFVHARLPGGWVAKGSIYAVAIAFVAMVIVIPLASQAGIFFRRTPAAFPLFLSTLLAHLTYGLSLTLGLRIAGVQEFRTRSETYYLAHHTHVGMQAPDESAT